MEKEKLTKEKANKKTIALDEDFLNWWAEGLERGGYDLYQRH